MSRTEDNLSAWFGLAVIVAVVVLIGCTFTGCNADYSDGQRAGELRKFSRKGVMTKSWEGTLLLSDGYVRRSDGSGSPDVWAFSVTDEAVARELEGKVGSRVSVDYRQWLVRPVFKQDSGYTVVKVK
jgi:hypothetical protein